MDIALLIVLHWTYCCYIVLTFPQGYCIFVVRVMDFISVWLVFSKFQKCEIKVVVFYFSSSDNNRKTSLSSSLRNPPFLYNIWKRCLRNYGDVRRLLRWTSVFKIFAVFVLLLSFWKDDSKSVLKLVLCEMSILVLTFRYLRWSIMSSCWSILRSCYMLMLSPGLS